VYVQDEIREAGLGAVVPTEVAPLSAALAEWLGDAEQRTEVAGRAREYVRERFDWNQIASRWIGHYQRLLEGVRETGRPVQVSGSAHSGRDA
jgi:glycosyltransferase involved in cell wall biosynthesis